jgi:hypothetical protein
MTDDSDKGLPVTTVALDATRVAILKKLEEIGTKSRRSDIKLIFVQACLTAILGLVVWQLQVSVTRKIEDAKAMLSARLALSQEFFKQRISVYTQLHTLALALRDADIQVRAASELRHSLLVKGSKQLYDYYTANSLYVSPELLTLVGQLWREAMDADRAPFPATSPRLPTLTDQMELLMRRDLHVEELADQVFTRQP